MKKNIDIKLIVLVTLICTYIIPTGLFDLSLTIPKFLFLLVMGYVYATDVYETKKIKKSHIIFLLILLILTVVSRNINFLTFFPLLMLDKVIENKEEIIDYLKKSNILYICLIFTIIYSFIFIGRGERYAFAAIRETNQSGLAIFCLSMIFMKINKKMGRSILLFGLLTFSRSYFVAVILYLLSKSKFLKDKVLKERFIKFFNYLNITIASSVILILLGIFYISQYQNGNILPDSMIKNRLFQFFDYSNYFRFSAIIIMLLIFKRFPKKILFGMSDYNYEHYGKVIANSKSIPFRNIVPHNLFFSHLKIYGVFAIFEICYISKKIQKVINKENFFIYIAIAAYSIILGAGLYSYWLYLSMIMFIVFGFETSGDECNEK